MINRAEGSRRNWGEVGAENTGSVIGITDVQPFGKGGGEGGGVLD